MRIYEGLRPLASKGVVAHRDRGQHGRAGSECQVWQRPMGRWEERVLRPQRRTRRAQIHLNRDTHAHGSRRGGNGCGGRHTGRGSQRSTSDRTGSTPNGELCPNWPFPEAPSYCGAPAHTKGWREATPSKGERGLRSGGDLLQPLQPDVDGLGPHVLQVLL
eukprot:EG_transcript_20927